MAISTLSSLVINKEAFLAPVAVATWDATLDALAPKVREDIVPWVERTIDMSFDKTASLTGKCTLYPYQREPLSMMDDRSIRQVTVMAGQRLGKSQLWKFALLKRIHDGGVSGLIVYPSLVLAETTNRDTVKPLLQCLPYLAEDMAVRGNIKKDAFVLPSRDSVIAYQGGGTQIISSTRNFCVLDEGDFVECANDDAESKSTDQVKAIRLRMQTFRERMLIVVSSPTQHTGVVAREFRNGSMGVWHLRCTQCREYTRGDRLAIKLQDDTYAGLQWDKDKDKRIIEDSIRWICPHCRYEHTYDQAEALNADGMYIHEYPELHDHRSYSVGALANPWIWTWLEIAQAQEDAVDADGRKYLSNTILGRPYTHKREGQSTEILEAVQALRATPPEDAKLSCITMGIDQQFSDATVGKYWCYVARAWYEDGSSYLLDAGQVVSYKALEEKVQTKWLQGRKALVALCDQGGFATDTTLDAMVASNANLWYQKGSHPHIIATKGTEGLYLRSDNQAKLLLVNAPATQVKLLELMYNSGKWFTSEHPHEAYEEQMSNIRPNTRMTKNQIGESLANWCTYGDRRKDYFDCERYALLALRFACWNASAASFAQGNKPLFWRQEMLRQLRRQGGTGNK